jgi:hypothetical protein
MVCELLNCGAQQVGGLLRLERARPHVLCESTRFNKNQEDLKWSKKAAARTFGLRLHVPTWLQFSRIQVPCQHQQAFKKIIISHDELAFVCRILRSGVCALVEAALCEYSGLSFV